MLRRLTSRRCIIIIIIIIKSSRYSQKNDFQYGSRPPYWICCDVIILHPGTLYYVPNIVLNFHLDWFSYFLIYLEFHVSSFWLEIAYLGQIFRVLVGK